MNGIILINKEKDWTSQDVLSKLKSIIKYEYGENIKIGHSGTLDPLATGLMVVLLGNARKLSQIFLELDKEYIAKIKLGTLTDSLDITGKVLEKESEDVLKEKVFNLNKDKIQKVLNTFLGTTKQIPPIYSALKHEGRNLYKLARDKEYSDEKLEEIIKSKERDINIKEIKLLDFNKQKGEIKIRVICSSGTYIRSLALDIAEKLGTIGVISELNRIKVSEFKTENGTEIKKIEKMDKQEFQKNILSLEQLPFIHNKFKGKICLEEKRIPYFLSGVRCTYKGEEGLYLVYSTKDINKINKTNEKQEYTFIGTGSIKDNLVKREYIEVDESKFKQ